MMGRAELRRSMKNENKAKTATYNLTKAQLDAMVREQIAGELEKVRQQAENFYLLYRENIANGEETIENLLRKFGKNEKEVSLIMDGWT